ncbi:MAG TPA: hypothetical protein VGF55_10865 [Gemmataceae bacterium]|jgi:hypothetical protein
MTVLLRIRPVRLVGAVVGLALFFGLSAAAFGQADLIGARGGQTVPPPPTLPTTPVLPPTLNLPPQATSSLLNGLNASGTALRPGMGWLVSDLTHQDIHGQQLADVIHQLKPYKQQGVLTFPQNTSQPGAPTPAPTAGHQPQGSFPSWPGHGNGHGKGGGKGGKGHG